MAGRLLIAFIAVPIIELWLLIQIGRQIGVLATIAIVILTAVIGTQLVRRQGLDVLQRIRETQARGEPPALPLVNGAALMMAGFMLLTPGFLTDIAGFGLLVPKLRERLAHFLLRRIVVLTPFGQAGGGSRRSEDDIIEGEYQRGPKRSRDELRDRDRR